MKDIEGFEGLYAVTTDGQVYSYRRKKYLKQSWSHSSNDGYLQVTLCKDGFKKIMKVHRLVAEAYIPNPNNYDTIDHINGIKEDNRVENLQWMSRRDNIMKYVKGENTNMYGNKKRSVKCLDTNEIFESINAAAKAMGLDSGSISKVCRGEMTHTKNFHFEFVIEEE